MARPKIAFVIGTRPDAIKSAPVILEFQRYPELCQVQVLSTGQHREMLNQVLEVFGINPDINLDIMTSGQSLTTLSSRILQGLGDAMEELKPDYLMAQGDTTTTFMAGLASFYRQIPFGHIEAGLRTDTIWNPFPEEFNRRAVGLFAAHHFAPTQESAQALLAERIPAETVFVTGNSGIDAVQAVAAKSSREWFPEIDGRIVLLTTHRRENWGEPQRRIANAAHRLVQTHEDIHLVVPMHLNPDVRATLREVLDGHDRIHLIEPPDYLDFVPLMRRANLILTDSGGIQEEAPSFGKPVLILRDTTERPEGVSAGVAKLIGTEEDRIFDEATLLLANTLNYEIMAQARSPYGDGRTSQRIRYLVLRALGLESPPEPLWI